MPSLFPPPQIEANPISITRKEIPSVLAHREKKGGRRGGKRSRNGSVSRGGGEGTHHRFDLQTNGAPQPSHPQPWDSQDRLQIKLPYYKSEKNNRHQW